MEILIQLLISMVKELKKEFMIGLQIKWNLYLLSFYFLFFLLKISMYIEEKKKLFFSTIKNDKAEL